MCSFGPKRMHTEPCDATALRPRNLQHELEGKRHDAVLLVVRKLYVDTAGLPEVGVRPLMIKDILALVVRRKHCLRGSELIEEPGAIGKTCERDACLE